MPEKHWPQIQPGEPACYRIAVIGRLDQHWSGRLGGMQIASEQQGDQPITIMTGQVKDQAELVGVLNTVHQMRMTILSVICEACDESEDNL